MGTGSTSTERSLAAVILAAGKGKRMRSDLPKVVHEVAGAPMVVHVVRACVEAGCGRIVVVVGHGEERVRGALAGLAGRVRFAVQEEQAGTGHAVACAAAALGDCSGTDVLVLCGDGPLIRARTIRALVERHRAAGASATLATSVVEDPSGYGRVVRDASGGFAGIVEERHLTEEQRSIREINPSYYCFDGPTLFSAVGRLERHEGSGEYYLTDVPGLLASEGHRVEVVDAVPPEDVLSVNTPEDLAKVDAILRARVRGGAA